MNAPVQLENVWKSYGKLPAVRGLSLNVPVQSIYGFLGPNGAGKSTTIRMVLGLQRPDRGTVRLFGHPLAQERLTALRRIGSLVESPSLYEHLTGRENLEVHRQLLDLPRNAIDEALVTVDLLQSANRLVRGYSLGMRQRLGIAQALLGGPELLVLDEPTNGLDPAGIREVRDLIRNLRNRCQTTVFLSTHLLAEVEQVATHLAVISQGELKFEGTPQELIARGHPTIVIEVDQPNRAHALLSHSGHSVTIDSSFIRVAPATGCNPSQLNAILVKADIAVSQLATHHRELEDSFLELTSSPKESTEKEML